MKTFTNSRIFLFVAILLVSAPAVLWAGDKTIDQPAEHSDHSLIVIGNKNGDTSLVYEDGRLTITTRDGDDVTTRMMDMEAMSLIAADIADEVMSDLGNVLADLDDMQLQIRVGQDNRLNVSFDESEFELDLDAIMSQVALAMKTGFLEFNTSEWTSHEDRDDISDDELRAELHDLKVEIRELRREIERAIAEEK